MLLIKTEVRPSIIQGLGLFTLEELKKGQLIYRWEDFFGWSIEENRFDSLPEMSKELLNKYGWRENGKWLMDIDNSRFVNHSYTPNILVDVNNILCVYAIRDIDAGEELTENYSTFDPDFDKYVSELK